jgi:PASTA domain-containing protein
MSDERDETRRFAPFDDETQAGGRPLDETQAGGRPLDETQAGGPLAGETRAQARPGDRTPGKSRSPRPDETAFLPPVDDWSADGRAADDWAAGRGKGAWSGRAAVRAPQPGPDAPAEGDWPAGGSREPRDRWWLPIVIGVVGLILLAALGWAISLVLRNSGEDTPPAPAPSAATTVAPSSAAATTTEPSSSPPTTNPTSSAATATPTTTTDPTIDAVTVPALRGLTLTDAGAALTRMGLHYRLRYLPSDATPETVVDSDPPEGQEVPPDTTITLLVAAPATTVPTTATTSAPAGP